MHLKQSANSNKLHSPLRGQVYNLQNFQQQSTQCKLTTGDIGLLSNKVMLTSTNCTKLQQDISTQTIFLAVIATYNQFTGTGILDLYNSEIASPDGLTYTVCTKPAPLNVTCAGTSSNVAYDVYYVSKESANSYNSTFVYQEGLKMRESLIKSTSAPTSLPSMASMLRSTGSSIFSATDILPSGYSNNLPLVTIVTVPPVSASSSNSINVGLIVGATVGSVCGAAIIVLIIAYMIRKRELEKAQQLKESRRKLEEAERQRLEVLREEEKQRQDDELKKIAEGNIKWGEIVTYSGKTIDEFLLGEGTFSKVVRAIWNQESSSDTGTTSLTKKDVAVKVLKESMKTDPETRKEQLEKAKDEVMTIKEAEHKLANKDFILKIYGIVYGELPDFLAKELGWFGSFAVGIVMRFEEGGTLSQLIHQRRSGVLLPMEEKIRLLTQIARGLAELHDKGIVHADIKPDNILLSRLEKPDIRFADFGLAEIFDTRELGASSGGETDHTQGTLVYCAPEMLVNPITRKGANPPKVAKASRKTDVYAFSILAWELLTERKPFEDAKSEIQLSKLVHKGVRPNTIRDGVSTQNSFPSDCPNPVIEIIESCWSADLEARKSALDCFTTFHYEYGLIAEIQYDIFISTSSKDSGSHAISLLFQRLTQKNYRVYYESKQVDVRDATKNARVLDVISKSRVILACLDETYQTDKNEKALNYLERARNTEPPRKIIPIFMSKYVEKQTTPKIMFLCQLKDKSLKKFDFSMYSDEILARSCNKSEHEIDSLADEKSRTREPLEYFYDDVDDLIIHLGLINCKPLDLKHNSQAESDGRDNDDVSFGMSQKDMSHEKIYKFESKFYSNSY